MIKNKLNSVEIQGYKSIKHLKDFKLGNLNVLIGANGSGKSNFISFFKMLNAILDLEAGLGFFIEQSGRANSLLHDGASATPQIEGTLNFESIKGSNEYSFRLVHVAVDNLIFAEEKWRYSDKTRPTTKASWIHPPVQGGYRETNIIEAMNKEDKTAQSLHHLMKRCIAYQFHNTSDRAGIKQYANVADGLFLKSDASNLAPFLFRLYNDDPEAYRRIVDTIKQIAPFFSDFVLEPERNSILLRWKEKGNPHTIFGAHQASDGTLRAMALVSLLLQPANTNVAPYVIIIDEPELGLHPYAINIVAGLLQSVSTRTQIIISTQSKTLVDCFTPEDIIVVDRIGRESKFSRLDSSDLEEWLDEYSLSEIWEKNIIGGKPRK